MSGATAVPGRVCRRMSAQCVIMACMSIPELLPLVAGVPGGGSEGDIGLDSEGEVIVPASCGAPCLDAQAAGRIATPARSPIAASFFMQNIIFFLC